MSRNRHHDILFTSTELGLALCHLLPEVDVIKNIEQIFTAQQDILDHLIQKRHYGDDKLDEFEDHMLDSFDAIELMNKKG